MSFATHPALWATKSPRGKSTPNLVDGLRTSGSTCRNSEFLRHRMDKKHYNKPQMNDFQENREIVKRAVQAGLNVLVEGPHGVGKTSLALDGAAELNLRVKYWSASTLDPFDLVGIPVPVYKDGVPLRIVYRR